MRGVDAVKRRWHSLGHRTRTAVAAGTVAVVVAGAASAGVAAQRHADADVVQEASIDTLPDGGMAAIPGTVTLIMTRAFREAVPLGGDAAQAAWAMQRHRPYLVGRGDECGAYVMTTDGRWFTLPQLARVNAAGVAARPGVDPVCDAAAAADPVPVTGTLDTGARDATVDAGGVYVASHPDDTRTACHTTLYAPGGTWEINHKTGRHLGGGGRYLDAQVDAYGCASPYAMPAPTKAHVTTAADACTPSPPALTACIDDVSTLNRKDQ